MDTIPDLSALYRPSKKDRKRDNSLSHILSNWYVDDPQGDSKSAVHPSFNAQKGEFTAPRDGLYTVVVQLIPTDGGANVAGALQRRQDVNYVLRIDEQPSTEIKDSDDDAITTQFLDIGPVSFGEVLHLRAGSCVSIAVLPDTVRRDSVRLKIGIVQRKRKRDVEPTLTKKELKKLKKQKKRAKRAAEIAAQTSDGDAKGDGGEDDALEKNVQDESKLKVRKREDEEDSDSSAWSAEFFSDESGDDLPHSKKGVSRLAKRLKSTSTGFRAPTSA